MQEFSSVTASSYDADSLAPILTDKAREGWSVVSIVAAGTSIVAYLSREADATDAASDEDTAAPAGTDGAASDAPDATPPTADDDGSEPAGWGTANDSDSSDEDPGDELGAVAAGTGVAPVAGVAAAAALAHDDGDHADDGAGRADDGDHASDGHDDGDTAAATGPAPTDDGVPAGWYADPSGRYELRYWDGSAWTEHVSRAGQQYTDPPVA